MAKSNAIETALSDLAALRGKPPTPEGRAQISAGLKSKVNLVAARAAKLVNEFRLIDLEGELIAGFNRFMTNPTTSDKQCAAKLAIAETLYDLDIRADDLFIAGARHVQLEPVWGDSADSAIELRGRCAMALVKCTYRQIMPLLVDHLGDPNAQARIAAARTLAATGRDDAALLLRLKALTGDREAEVTAECITGLMQVDPKKSLDFVARFLEDASEIISHSAALAIGQSRLPEALICLQKQLDHRGFIPASHVFLCIAMTRLPEAIAFLIDRAGQSASDAAEIIPALGIYKHDEAISARLKAAVELHKSRALAELLADQFSKK